MKLYSIFFRDMKYCCWILPKFRSDKSFKVRFNFNIYNCV